MPLMCELLLRFDEFELLELSDFELLLLLELELLLLELELLSLSLSSLLAFDLWCVVGFGADDVFIVLCRFVYVVCVDDDL